MAEYYENAFNAIHAEIWKGTKFKDYDSLGSLSYYRALTCFYSDSRVAVKDRRELLYNYLKNEFDEEKTIKRYRNVLPIRSSIKRILNNLCVAYSQLPERSFVQDAPKWMELYRDSGINTHFQEAYKLATLTGVVAVRPLIKNGELKVLIFTPDEFRVEGDDLSKPDAVIYPEIVDGKVVYRTWSDTEFYTRDDKGNLIRDEYGGKNPYRIMPFIFLRTAFSQGEFWTPGLFDLAETQLQLNRLKFIAHLDVAYNGLPIKIATNIPADYLKLGIDSVIEVSDVVVSDVGQKERPDLKFIKPSPQYSAIEEHKQILLKEMMSEHGLPPSLISGDTASIVSGVSRLIERQELIDRRNSDLPRLKRFEQEFANIVSIVLEKDLMIQLDPEMSVDFAEESILTDPASEFELDTKLAQNGLTDPLNYLQKWGGLDSNVTKDDAIRIVQERKQIYSDMFNNSNNNIHGSGNTGTAGAVPGAGGDAATQTGPDNSENSGTEPGSEVAPAESGQV